MIPHTTMAQTDAVERPLTLIEKLERESDRLHKLSVDFSHDTRLRLINEALGIYRAIDIVKKHQAKSDWISVDERLPDKDGKYLVYCVGNRELTKDRKELSIMRFNQKTKGGWFALSPLFKVIYRQPIQPPSEVKDD